MKTVKSASIKAKKRVRKSVRAESSAYLAAPPKGRACHPREGGASQPYFDDFEALTSSQGVLYLKNSATTIKHLLQPFQKLEKRYGRNLHGFSADIENFLKRLQGVIDFLDRENEISTRPDVFASVIDFLYRSRALHQEVIALPPSPPPPENVVFAASASSFWFCLLHSIHLMQGVDDSDAMDVSPL